MKTKSTIAVLEPRLQLAALPWRLVDGRVEVLMVTSRLSGHWLIPKGWPMKGKTNPEAAAQEAFEEAGVKGVVGSVAVGRYSYEKLIPGRPSVPCNVDVYALYVGKELPKWPETGERQRQWISIGDAAALVFEPNLAALLRDLDPTLFVAPATADRKRGSRS